MILKMVEAIALLAKISVCEDAGIPICVEERTNAIHSKGQVFGTSVVLTVTMYSVKSAILT
jgi:hypothetical protein